MREPISTRDALDRVFRRWARTERAPAVAWGLVRDGVLDADGGIGTLRLGADAPPDADSVFRIASMTKSFTGAALMSLVVEGRLRLDDPLARHVPELAPWRGPTVDGPPLTVRHLVSMESGLPTDDPWADRHLDLSDEAMTAVIDAGASFAWAPGVRFEYSNLGWGLVGRLVERVTGVRVQDLVSRRLLEPLGMTATSWVRPDRDGAEVAAGYRLRDGEPVPETEPLGDGAIAPMGGLWTSVRDLATWVGFMTDAFPPRDDPDEGPLPRWARREMQQLRRLDEVARVRPSPAGPSRVAAIGYGIGLVVRVDERLGTSVGHSGGLPGFGSHMRWLPERGLGVVAVSNVTYGSMHAACMEALEVLADRDELGPDRGASDRAPLDRAAIRAAALLSGWSDAAADELFDDNAGLDEPFARRASEAAAIVDRAGRLEVEGMEPETPLRGAFVTAGGDVRVELGLDHVERVQWLDVEDRMRPSDGPLLSVVDASLVGTATVVVRPAGDLADAFGRWQGELLDRLPGPAAAVPGPHLRLAAYGAPSLTVEDERRLQDLVDAWAATVEPLELVAASVGSLGTEGEIGVRLVAGGALIGARDELRRRAAAAGISAVDGEARVDAGHAWVPSMSLASQVGIDARHRSVLEAWAASVDVGGSRCFAGEAELLAYDADGERRLGRYRFGV